MLSLSRNEAIRRGPWTCLSCSSTPWTLHGWIASSSRPIGSPTHQRKHSSSKPSSPPKDESRTLNTPSESPTKEVKPLTKERTEHRSSTRLNRRKSKDLILEANRTKDEARQNLPSVPSTQAIKPQDIHLASFFSIHRPISVTTSVPPASNPVFFSKIFTPKLHLKPHPPNVIYTIASAVENLENPTAHTDYQQSQQRDFETVDLHNAISQMSSSISDESSQYRNLHINVQEAVKHLYPFVPPPPPVAELPTRKKSRKSATTKQKSYSTVFTIVESTHPDGRKTYKSEMVLPLREDTNPTVHRDPSTTIHISPPPPQQPFLNHMRERQLRWEQFREKSPRPKAWLALSVRRQRKLKMKKHKYKKLMRRTRNLRRKLDRA